LNSVEIREVNGIEYKFSFGAKEGLVEKLPERESKLDVVSIHRRKILENRCEIHSHPLSGVPIKGWLLKPWHIAGCIFLVRITEH
jgi:hypothetical protein